MRKIRLFALSTLTTALLLAGCRESTESSAELEGVPELAAVELALTGDPKSEGVATEIDAIDPEALAADELEAVGVPTATDTVELKRLREAARDINESLRASLSPIAALVRETEPTTTKGKLKIWGPIVRGATDYRFLLREASTHRWGWRLEARPSEGNSDFARVAAGKIAVDGAPRRGAGAMGFDFDSWAAVDPTIAAQGQLLLGFKHGPRGTTVGYALRDFSVDSESQSGVDALFRAVRLSDGRSRARLAYRGNVAPTATDAEELVLARVRHTRSEGGRADLIATEGDVAEGTALVISECWDQELRQVFHVVRSCPLDSLGDKACTVESSSGSNDACPRAMRLAEYAPTDPEAEMVDSEDPNESVSTPGEIPEMDGE